MVLLSHSYMTIRKTIVFTIWSFISKVMSLLFKTLSRFVIACLPRSKRLLISWLQSPSAVILEPKKIKSNCFYCFPIYLPMKWWDQMPWSLFFECWVLSQLFDSPLFTFIKRLFSSSLLFAIRVVSSAYLRLLMFLPAVLLPARASSSPAFHMMYSDFPGGLEGKASTCKCGRPGFDPWVREDPLEKEMATHSSTLAWKIPWTEKPGRPQSMGSQRVGHDWATSLSLSFHSSNKINKRADNIHPWHTALAYSVVPCLVLSVAFWPAYRFLRRQVRGLVFLSL